MATITLGTMVQEWGRKPAQVRWRDGDLLEHYIQRRDEDAFAALMRCHGPMVLGVCQRILRNATDVEDAFQATFLVLIHKAATVQPRQRVGNWLYGVACTTALKVRALSMKRKSKEQQATPAQQPASPDNEEMLAQLDQELRQLPDIYRTAIVLCELEGRTIKQVAEELRCPPSTISARLARGRRLLAERLTKPERAMNIAAVVALLAQASAEASLSPQLLQTMIHGAVSLSAGKAVNAVFSAQVVALAQGAMQTMLLSKLPVTAVAFLLVLLFGSGMVGAAVLVPQDAPATGTVEPSPVQPLKPRQAANFIWAALVAPDGKRLIVSEGEDLVRLWESNYQPGPVFQGATQSVRTLALSPDGTLLAGGCNDSHVYVWEMATQKLLYKTQVGRGLVLTVAFSPDGSTLAVAGHQFNNPKSIAKSSVFLLNAQTGKLQQSWDIPDGEINLSSTVALAFHPNSKELAVLQHGRFTGIKLIDPATGKERRRIEYESPLLPQSLTYSPDGQWLACGGIAPPLPDPNDSRLFGSPMGNLKIWDATTGQLVKTLFDDSDGDVKTVAFSKNGKKFYTSTTMKRGEPVQTPQGLIGRLGTSCQCWDTERWRMEWDARFAGGISFSLSLSPDQQRMVLANTAGCWLLPDLATGRAPRQIAATPETPPANR